MALGMGLMNAGSVGPATGAQAQVMQLAERTSLLVASVQKQIEVEREETGRQLEQVGVRLDSRIASLESRLAACEDQNAVRERRECEALAAIPSRVLRETRALISGSINEAQSQWRAQRVEFAEECRELSRRLDELSEQGHQGARQIQEAENLVEDQACTVRQLQEDIQVLQAAERPAWFTDLEGHVGKLEKRMEEQLLSVELRLQQRRQEVAESMQSFQEDLLGSMEARVEQEIERALSEQRGAQGRPSQDSTLGAAKDLVRRLDDVDARVSALRVRVDSHDSRFSTVAERAEAACQQALETARQTTAHYKEEIISEADCQIKILRQRVEALGELCDELSLREVARNSHHGAAGAQRAAPTTSFSGGGAADRGSLAEQRAAAAGGRSLRGDADLDSGIHHSSQSYRPPAMPF